ncbi:hypothetical protein J4217_03590 [Candidatus Pacearchaeota archaeon]|nr:hypothetical protein [Candidatus Pacearchaeota archaeon]
MNKKGHEHSNWIEAVFALIVGFLIVISVPQLKTYFDQLVGAIFAGIILGLIVAIIIFVVWWILNKEGYSL